MSELDPEQRCHRSVRTLRIVGERRSVARGLGRDRGESVLTARACQTSAQSAHMPNGEKAVFGTYH